MPEDRKFPAWLKHPNFQPAVLSNSAKGDAPGRPALFPPVIVNNEEQMEEYVGKGYLPASAPAEAVPFVVAPENEYPKWVNGVLCKNREQEEEVLTKPKPVPSASNPAEDEAKPFNQIGLQIEAQLRDSLIARANASGIKIDPSATVQEIQAQVQKVVMGHA